MPALAILLPLGGLFAWIGIAALVATARQWTGRPVRRPLSRVMAVQALHGYRYRDTEGRLAYDRAGLAFGFSFLFLAVCVATLGVFFALNPAEGSGTSAVLGAVLGCSLLGLMLSAVLFGSIKYFNWPKMLVPPPLRGEPGAVAGRRQRRENLRKPL